MSKSNLLPSSERILEAQADAVYAKAFSGCALFCDTIRRQIGVSGLGWAESVSRQTGHHSDGGTIDLDVLLSGQRLLIENKISASWSYTQKGENQVDRYTRSAAGFGARTILFAPRKYLWSANRADDFDAKISYESLLPCFAGADYELLCQAIDQAVIPVENPDDSRTIFFDQIAVLMAEVTPGLRMNMRNRNEGSYTVHLDVAKSLRRHVGIPAPSVFLQLQQANVKLMVREWGWAVDRLTSEAGLAETGIRLERVKPRGTLAFRMETPFVDCRKPFESQVTKVGQALLVTNRLCRWWDANEALLRRFLALV